MNGDKIQFRYAEMEKQDDFFIEMGIATYWWERDEVAEKFKNKDIWVMKRDEENKYLGPNLLYHFTKKSNSHIHEWHLFIDKEYYINGGR